MLNLLTTAVLFLSASCQSEYTYLRENLEWSRYGHQVAAYNISQGLNSPIYGSVDQQLALIERYNQRLYALDRIAVGDDTYLAWLTQDLLKGKQEHEAWISYLTAVPDSPVNFGPENIERQRFYSAMYDWRLFSLNKTAENC